MKIELRALFVIKKKPFPYFFQNEEEYCKYKWISRLVSRVK